MMEILLKFEQLIIHTVSSFSFWETGLLILCFVFLMFSKSILKRVGHLHTSDERYATKLHTFRVVNLLTISFIVFYKLFLPIAEHTWVTKALYVLLLIYLGYLAFNLSIYFIKKRYGREREVNGERTFVETYNSRALTLFSAVFIFVAVLIAIVRILGFESLLEAGGVIGFVGVFLALTQGSWAPDIISGLIILNSNLFEEGDVIELKNGERMLGVIFKTKVFHTEVLNVINNHRIMIKNSRLRDMAIHNLSKFASAKGLREVLHFNISYDVSVSEAKAMFNDAFETAKQDPLICIEHQYPLEINVDNTGDYAVVWAVYYYTKNVRYLVRTRQLFRELILEKAQEHQISLGTPMQHVVDMPHSISSM